MKRVQTIPVARADMAQSALFEITSISIALRDLAQRMVADEQDFLNLSRGMLARIQTLSETTSECLDPSLGQNSDAEIFGIVECRPPSKREIQERELTLVVVAHPEAGSSS